MFPVIAANYSSDPVFAKEVQSLLDAIAHIRKQPDFRSNSPNSKYLEIAVDAMKQKLGTFVSSKHLIATVEKAVEIRNDVREILESINIKVLKVEIDEFIVDAKPDPGVFNVVKEVVKNRWKLDIEYEDFTGMVRVPE